MKYHLVCGNLIKNYQNINIKDNLKEYINNNRQLLDDIYFKAKKIDTNKINEILNEEDYLNTIKDIK